MTVWLVAFAVSCFGYLLGSFPTGYFAGRLAGIDIRSVGSGNIGATNVLRVLGKQWGYAVFFVDSFKGFAAVRVAFYVAQQLPFARGLMVYFGILAAIMCVIGHIFPIWLCFKGGKGVATSSGAVFGLMPLAALIVFLVWVVVFEMTRYVSVASLVAASALPVTVALLIHWEKIEGDALLYLSIMLTALVLWRHRSNFSRLLKGTEQRFSRK